MLPSVLIGEKETHWHIFRASLWWGLLITTVFAYAINLLLPLRSLGTGVCFLVLLCVLGIPGWILFSKQKIFQRNPRTRISRWLAGTFILTALYFATTALGPVTNYDSGLYHLGAIHYAGDYSTIPGLANLYFAFGYGNAEFPLAALLGNGPWNGEGFRLLNGFIVLLLLIEIAWRLRSTRLGAGTYVLLIGAVMVLVPMTALADYWVTSPSQDSSVFVVTLVAVAYFTDVVTERLNSMLNCAVVLALSMMLVLLRPTMIAFGATVVLVVAVQLWRQRTNIAGLRFVRSFAIIAGIGIFAAVFALLRDYVLSGWFQFPLSLHAFHVEWLAVDPITERIATLGYHRNPNDLWNAAAGWNWISSWIRRLPSQWESYEFLIAGILGIALIVYIKVRMRLVVQWRLLAVSLLPSAVAIGVWWSATPPSFRFAWGPVMSVPAVLIGWVMWRISMNKTAEQNLGTAAFHYFPILVSLPVLLVIVFTALTRTNWSSIDSDRTWSVGFQIPYAVTAIQTPQTSMKTLSSGLQVTVPTLNEQCWDNYQLCTPTTSETLRLRGSSIQDGFLQ